MTLKLVVLIIILIGVNFVFDARILTYKLFGFGDQNEGTTGLKIIGFILIILGSLIFYII